MACSDFTADTTDINDSSLEMDSENLSRVYISLDEIKRDTDSYIPPDDYAELMDLVIFYLKKDLFNSFRLRQPGTQHRARWMSSAIYTLKMLLLQTQLDLDPEILKSLELFGYFVAVMYTPSWFRARPVAAEAAVNDLQLYKRLLSLEKSEVLRAMATAAITALQRHLWYLCEELIPFALCSCHLQGHVKENPAAKLFVCTNSFLRRACHHKSLFFH